MSTNPFTTIRLLDSVPPRHRAALAGAVAFLVAGAIAASLHSRPAPEALRPIIVVTPTAAPARPTATAQPAPRVVELSDGTVAAFDGQRWAILREPQPAPAVEAPATVEPQVLVIHEASVPAAAAPEVAPDTSWHPPLTLPAGPSCQPGWRPPEVCQ